MAKRDTPQLAAARAKSARLLRARPRVQTVYVQMRVWSPAGRKIVHVPGKTVIFRGYSPDEVHRLICEAAKDAQERAEREANGKATTKGTSPVPDSADGVAYTPGRVPDSRG